MMFGKQRHELPIPTAKRFKALLTVKLKRVDDIVAILDYCGDISHKM